MYITSLSSGGTMQDMKTCESCGIEYEAFPFNPFKGYKYRFNLCASCNMDIVVEEYKKDTTTST
jgi:predicted RNA-binding Zn-ribbon protein involved in translation (DUF1610 family)